MSRNAFDALVREENEMSDLKEHARMERRNTMSNAKHTQMDAAAVAAYAAAKWPSAMQSPFALAVKSITVRDEAARHAVECLAARDGWDEETLSVNIESNFPELDQDECDEIARAAIAKARGE